MWSYRLHVSETEWYTHFRIHWPVRERWAFVRGGVWRPTSNSYVILCTYWYYFDCIGVVSWNFNRNLFVYITMIVTLCMMCGYSFLQRVSIACYAEHCISYSKSVRLSVRPSVCHTLALSQNDTSYDHGVFTGIIIYNNNSPMILVSSTLDFTAKFQREHGERGRQMREG